MARRRILEATPAAADAVALVAETTLPGAEVAAVICDRKTGSFLVKVSRDDSPGWEERRSDEGIEVFGRAEGIHSQAGC